MLEIQKKKEDLANMSLSQTMTKKELHEKRMEDLKVCSFLLFFSLSWLFKCHR